MPLPDTYRPHCAVCWSHLVERADGFFCANEKCVMCGTRMLAADWRTRERDERDPVFTPIHLLEQDAEEARAAEGESLVPELAASLALARIDKLEAKLAELQRQVDTILTEHAA